MSWQAMASELRNQLLQAESENAALKQEIERMSNLLNHAQIVSIELDGVVNDQGREIEQLRTDKAALLECVKWYGDSNNYDDAGELARATLSELKGREHQ